MPKARSVEPRIDASRIPVVTSPGMGERFGLDVLLVNPPSPNRDPFIRDTHRVGRNSREGTIWPQTSLAQLAAMLPTGSCNVQRGGRHGPGACDLVQCGHSRRSCATRKPPGSCCASAAGI